MKARDLIIQFRTFLPLFTDEFSDNLSISSISASGGVVTVNTATAHGLSTGDYVILSDIANTIPISSLTSSGEIATAVTSSAHDLTQIFTPTVTIEGATESDYNGTFLLNTVTDKNNFTYKLLNSTTSPATGSPKLLEKHTLGFNGAFEITVTSPTSFTVLNSNTKLLTGSGANMKVKSNIRISGGSDIDRIIGAYTKQLDNELYGFVILEDTDVSKDRNLLSDATVQNTKGDNLTIMLIENFSFYVFIPTSNDITGRRARDLAEDLFRPINRSITGYIPESPFVSTAMNLILPIGHGIFNYNSAYYIHRYSFQYIEYIVSEPVFNPTSPDDITDEFFANGGDIRPIIDTVALREFILRQRNDFDEIVKTDRDIID